jgi:hypothetical protein
MNSTTVSTLDKATNPIFGDQLTMELTATGKFMIWSSLASALFLTQIAYNIGEFPVALDLICYALFTLFLLLSGYAALSVPSLLLFTCAIALAAFVIPFARSSTSWSSLALLAALYFPFSLRLPPRPNLEVVQEYILNAYITAASAIAAIAIVQLVLVNAAHVQALGNIYFVLPEAIRGAGSYTFFREGGGGIVKANGFFLRESADLSFMTALGLIIEFNARKRLHILGLLAAGLLASLSGSGFIALFAGLVLPRSINKILTFFVSATGLFLLIFVLYKMDIPFLSLWFSRFSEFSTPNSSAYARFVAPWEMLQYSFDDGIVTTWLGNGAGSFFRDITKARFQYEVSDPTWSKLTYEYGLVGLMLVSSIQIIRLYSSALRAEVCNFLLLGWFSFAFLLKPSYTLIFWLLSLVPRMNPRSGSKIWHPERHI